MLKRPPAVAAGIAVLTAAAATVAFAALPASAATGCSVQYTIDAQWPGGFGE
ncbi:MAG TPA: hypothetical protein VK028_02335 [Micromonosporaceae bacterium]|nr:hypothetical protein [Micromonosporaceae bacterium]